MWFLLSTETVEKSSFIPSNITLNVIVIFSSQATVSLAEESIDDIGRNERPKRGEINKILIISSSNENAGKKKLIL